MQSFRSELMTMITAVFGGATLGFASNYLATKLLGYKFSLSAAGLAAIGMSMLCASFWLTMIEQ